MELAFPEGDCICSISIGHVDLLLGGGCLKAYEAGIICMEKRLLFFIESLELGQRASDVSPTGFEVCISKRNHSMLGLKRPSFSIL